MTTLAAAVEAHTWCPDYFLVGDEAYVCTENLLTPFPGNELSNERSSYNYFISRMRQTIERSFGILVARCGIFWRPLKVNMKRWGLVIACCIKLHNLCIETQGEHAAIRVPDEDLVWGSTPIRTPVTQDNRRGSSTSAVPRRERIVAYLANEGIYRPILPS